MRPPYEADMAKVTPIIETIMTERRLRVTTVEGMMGKEDHSLHRVMAGARPWTLYLLWQVCRALDLQLSDILRRAGL